MTGSGEKAEVWLEGVGDRRGERREETCEAYPGQGSGEKAEVSDLKLAGGRREGKVGGKCVRVRGRARGRKWREGGSVAGKGSERRLELKRIRVKGQRRQEQVGASASVASPGRGRLPGFESREELLEARRRHVGPPAAAAGPAAAPARRLRHQGQGRPERPEEARARGRRGG